MSASKREKHPTSEHPVAQNDGWVARIDKVYQSEEIETGSPSSCVCGRRCLRACWHVLTVFLGYFQHTRAQTE